MAAGSVYGIVAIAYAVVYRLTGVVHFAIGDMIGVAVFATLFVAAGTSAATETSVAAPRLALALVLGVTVAAAIGAGGYAFAIQPFLARSSTIGWIAASAALAFALRAALEAGFARPAYVLPDLIPFDRIGEEGVVTVAGASLRVRDVFVALVGLLLAAAATALLRRTRSGRALEAIASDVEAARIVGLPVERLVLAAFAIAGGLAAIAALAAAPGAPFDASTGAVLGLNGLAAALVARFASLWRAFGAGVLLGLLQTAIASDAVWVAPELRDVLPLVLVLALVAARAWREPETVE